MYTRELLVGGALEITPELHADDRGVFLEWFTAARLSEHTGHRFSLAQANCSVSAAGTLRGIHFAQLPPGQAKYVSCLSGAVFDVVVDIRVGSPTYGTWDSVILDDVDRRAVYLSEGLGHAFLALSDDAVVAYLCSAPYAPGREHGLDPFDDDLGIEWPTTGRDSRPLVPLLSAKDRSAPTLEQARAAGLLPGYDETQDFVSALGR
jgi:dTDP-4-dehydrorhamnose 3,5-epimerase